MQTRLAVISVKAELVAAIATSGSIHDAADRLGIKIATAQAQRHVNQVVGEMQGREEANLAYWGIRL